MYRRNPYSLENVLLWSEPPVLEASFSSTVSAVSSVGCGSDSERSPRAVGLQSRAELLHDAVTQKEVQYVGLGACDADDARDAPGCAAAGAARENSVFVGQLPFAWTAGRVREMVKTLAGVDALRIERILKRREKTGCFHVHVRSGGEADALKALHGRVLCDADGAWVAMGNPEVLVTAAKLGVKAGRCAKQVMVAEETKSTRLAMLPAA